MNIAFIIMQIGNPELDQVCAKAMVPALKSCGLEPKRVDKHNKGGLLKSEIIQLIERSEIIIADLTNERPNCYLEIGYAMGINKFQNLILTVREDHFPESPTFVPGGPKVHFDLAGYDILSWKTDELDAFREELEKRIKRRLAIIEQKEKESVLVWDNEWLERNRKTAIVGLTKSKLPGSEEMCFALYPPKPTWDQHKLDEAARRAENKNSGWPIGVYVGNREEFRPKPRSDGIVAEIATGQRSSYDYWYIRGNGDFYFLSSLIEDLSNSAQLFLDRRVIRATEGLFYCVQLYSRLGVDRSSKVEFSLHFTGLKERILTLASPNGHNPFPESRCVEDEMRTEVSTSLKEIDANTVSLVKKLLTPVFMLFDFFELSDSNYEELVSGFRLGRLK